MNGNELRKELESAGRYEEVTDLLRKISCNVKNEEYPINPFRDIDGITVWRIHGSLIREEALKLMIYLKGDERDKVLLEKEPTLHNLQCYVNTHSDMLLHNYAVSITHGRLPSFNDIEIIRVWCVLGNLIDSFSFDRNDKWTIPEGWKK